MKKRHILRNIGIVIGALVGILFAGGFVLRSLNLIRAFNVPTSAMSPFLKPGDHVLVETLSSRSRTIQRGDVRVFTTEGISRIYGNGPTMYIKRVVGLPGDELVIREGTLWINGKPQSEVFESPVTQYTQLGVPSESSLVTPYVVPAAHYFVIGDNTGNSADSRMWGPVPKDNFRYLYLMHYFRSGSAPPRKP